MPRPTCPWWRSCRGRCLAPSHSGWIHVLWDLQEEMVRHYPHRKWLHYGLPEVVERHRKCIRVGGFYVKKWWINNLFVTLWDLRDSHFISGYTSYVYFIYRSKFIEQEQYQIITIYYKGSCLYIKDKEEWSKRNKTGNTFFGYIPCLKHANDHPIMKTIVSQISILLVFICLSYVHDCHVQKWHQCTFVNL